jgi:hypothetical protein
VLKAVRVLFPFSLFLAVAPMDRNHSQSHRCEPMHARARPTQQMALPAVAKISAPFRYPRPACSFGWASVIGRSSWNLNFFLCKHPPSFF